MRAIIISDIHGNLEYLEKIDKYISNNPVDKLIILGDIFGSLDDYKVAEILNKYEKIIECVRGNCDIRNDSRLIFSNDYDAKEIYLDNNKFIMTHGHLIPMLYDYIGDSLVLQGHSHVYNLEGQYINPGSLGKPRVNKEHTFILYEDNILKLFDISNFNMLSERKL